MEEIKLGDLIYSNDRESGGSVRVYKAQLGARNIAVKKELHETTASLNRALNEALVQAKFSGSSAVCEIISISVELHERSFESVLAMEWMDSDLMEEIEKRRKKDTQWTEDELLVHLYRLVEALESMQRRGICHRDLKPQNVFLSSGMVKLSDFGASKQNVMGNVACTIVGTPGYLSPELLVSYKESLVTGEFNARYNPFKSDVYSLGVTFLHMSLLSLPKSRSGEGLSPERLLQLLETFPKGFETIKGLIEKMTSFNSKTRSDFVSLFKEITIVKRRREQMQQPCMHCKAKLLTQESCSSIELECNYLHFFHNIECFEEFFMDETRCFSKSFNPLCPECAAPISHAYQCKVFGGEERFTKFIDACRMRCIGCCYPEAEKLPCAHVVCKVCLSKSSLPDRQVCPECKKTYPFQCDNCQAPKSTELQCGHVVCGRCTNKKRDKLYCEFHDDFSPLK